MTTIASTNRLTSMLYVSLSIEALRARPTLVAWTAALVQALLWVVVPTFFYAAPPGELPEFIAVGHEFQMGTYLGPPLAYWLAELALKLAGGAMIGVYVLSQACVLLTYWVVLRLGRSMVGERQAALAVLLMLGVSVFTVPTPEFGPSILAMPLWALVLLHSWFAIGQGRRPYWFALAIEIGLLLLTTYFGLIFFGLLVVFTLMTTRGRAALNSVDPWIAGVVILVVMFPHLLWLESEGDLLLTAVARLRSAEAVDANLMTWMRLAAGLIVAHAGLGLLVVLASGWPLARRSDVPLIMRRPVDPFARKFVYFFALMPPLVATVVTVLIGRSTLAIGPAPLLVLSGLAVIIAAGDTIYLHRQYLLNYAWVGLLLIPPAFAAASVAVLPWTLGIDLKVAQPANAMGQFFADNFQRRTGRPLAIVGGDLRTAAVVALAAPSRPSVFIDAQHSPWLSADDIKQKGAVLVWPATDTVGTPPTDVKQLFPDLVPEVPRAFERQVQGMLPLLRIGWAVIRPAQDAAAPSTR